MITKRKGNLLVEKFHNKKILKILCEDGSVCQERHYLDGELHRDNGPAIIVYKPNGLPAYRHYYKNGFMVGRI